MYHALPLNSAPPPAIPTLRITNLGKVLGGRRILHNISITTYSGEIFGCLGPNGSGKTTTIKLILGLLRLEEGQIEICGQDIQKNFADAMSLVGGIIENPEMYRYLTGRQNLECFARMGRDIPPSRIDEVAKLVHLEGRLDEKISRYSLGMRQRLGVAQALLGSPRLLVLDEPTNGLDPAGIKELRDTLKYLAKEQGVTVFISSHLLSELDQLCDRVAILDHGRVLDVMTMNEIRRAEVGENEQFHFTLQNAELGMEIFRRLEIPYTYEEATGVLTATMRKGSSPEAVKILAVEGAGILSVVPVKRSLEDAFLAVTQKFAEKGAPL